MRLPLRHSHFFCAVLAHSRSALAIAFLLLASADAQKTIDLNSESADITFDGEALGAGAGFSVASGNFNGDAYDDLLIGSFKNNGVAGRVYVVYGSATLKDTTIAAANADIIITAATAEDHLGQAVASGDINNDNIDDIIIGASNSDPNGRSDAGRVYVIYGSASLPSTYDLSTNDSLAVDLEIYGESGSDLLGQAVSSGDINGDGTVDLILSAPRADFGTLTNAGETYIIYGGGSLSSPIDLGAAIPDSADVTIQGKANSDESGKAVASGDINGDNYADVLIGASFADPNGSISGEVYVVHGGNSLPKTIDLNAADYTVQGAASQEQLGASVSSGNFNNDAYDDILIGTPGASPGGIGFAGETYVVYGSASLTGTLDLSSATADLTFWGDESNGSLGWSVASLNLNGDGFDDVVAAATFASPSSRNLAGKAHGIFWTPFLAATVSLDTATAAIAVLGDQAFDQLGYDVAGGDINNDGVDDLIIGANGTLLSTTGKVYVVFGEPPYVELSLPDISSLYDQTVTMPVSIDSTSGLLMVESEMHFAFDTDLLSLSAVNSGALTTAWTLGTTVAPGLGSTVDTLKVTGTNPGSPLTVKGEFINLDFLVKKLAQPTTSPVSFAQVTFNQGRPDWNTTTDGSVKLLGRDGLLAATLLSAPADTVRVRVTDIDLNLNSTAVETHSVTLQNSVTGERESLLLTEQSVDDSVFFGSIATVFGTGTSGDGFFNTQPGDELHVTYSDALDGLGNANSALDTNLVVVFGDADGGGSLQAYDSALILSHAANHLTLTGLDSLVANLDVDAPEGPITAFDAALAIQRRLGLISRFPVQEPSSKNHPQPETTNNPKPVVEERYLALASTDDYISVRADARDEILAADIVIEGIEGKIEMAPEMERFEMVFVNAEDGLHVAFAGPQAFEGEGELFRIYPTSGTARVSGLRGHFNGGRIAAYWDQSRPQASLPQRLALHPNMPNPFNAETLIRFDLPAAQTVELDVFNALGQKVRTLVQGRIAAGSHKLRWDSRDDRGQTVATGAYFYRLVAGKSVQTQRMMLVK